MIRHYRNYFINVDHINQQAAITKNGKCIVTISWNQFSLDFGRPFMYLPKTVLRILFNMIINRPKNPQE